MPLDRVFGPKCSTREVYDQGAKEVALSVVSGVHGKACLLLLFSFLSSVAHV